MVANSLQRQVCSTARHATVRPGSPSRWAVLVLERQVICASMLLAMAATHQLELKLIQVLLLVPRLCGTQASARSRTHLTRTLGSALGWPLVLSTGYRCGRWT
jgi:hypothetical protein